VTVVTLNELPSLSPSHYQRYLPSPASRRYCACNTRLPGQIAPDLPGSKYTVVSDSRRFGFAACWLGGQPVLVLFRCGGTDIERDHGHLRWRLACRRGIGDRSRYYFFGGCAANRL